MGLVDALSGNISHFNKVFVPAQNDIAKRIENIKDPHLSIVFAGFLSLMANRVIDYFFKPEQGNLIKVVKNYERRDADELLITLIIWFWIDLGNLGGLDRQESKATLAEILNTPKQGLEEKIKRLEHSNVGESEILWEQVSKVLKINRGAQGGYLAFRIQLSKICKEAYLEMGRDLQ
ncbi:MAG: hypothetical protein A2119_00050 [Candidatus Colwellbacteria bacterium GWA2_46_10]|uniref:Uncharacterized protein n=1 Tax=Candidatus Colwellbacteria bacterium GWA2_46_10 TaxID=1797684 RepID=A0A1G1YVS1_9BACT|nr:MAG: hypothetical protein UW86_C0004G0003 [Microgenomates group bacterium GW2011_GWA1_Microgenomates_45_10]KKU19538.1 MAG: hypothetical protein UX29_C0002G0011 [Parcubacteria group bacterium GW2011_GWA2_46_10]OGY56475.1 MAG: hypothetical protein A2119_00050 [Candidatus Colwellbacteria bacterium GWA2_46_10]